MEAEVTLGTMTGGAEKLAVTFSPRGADPICLT